MKEVSEIFEKMQSVFTEKTGFAMEDTADLAVRLYAAAAEIQTLYAYSDWAMKQSFPQTAGAGIEKIQWSLPAACKLAKKYKVEMPIVNAVDDILSGRLAARDALATMMGRQLKQE